MHDVLFAKRIVSLLKEKIGKSNDYKKVVVNATLGPFTHVTPVSLRSAFTALNEEEGFRDVLLNVEKDKAVIRCDKCGITTEIAKPVTACPKCNCTDFKLECAEEFQIKSLEIE